MIDIAFELNGHRIDPDSMQPGLERSMLATIREALGEKIGEVECARHHRPPRILCLGSEVNQLSMAIEGCCPQVIEKVEARL